MKHIAQLIGTVGWLYGVILAKGFWMTTAALIVPFVGWYLAIKSLAS